MIAVAVVFALLLGACLYVGLPRIGGWWRAGSVAAFVLLTGVVYAGSIDILGAPKPMRLEWRGMADAKVLAATMREGEAIYLWVQAADGAPPRGYALPWSTTMAQQVQDAMEKRESSGATVRMRTSGASEGGGGAGTPKLYAEPQRAGPPKSRARAAAAVHGHRGG